MTAGDLRTAQRVYCDANVLIYFIEKNSDYHGLVWGLLQDLRTAGAAPDQQRTGHRRVHDRGGQARQPGRDRRLRGLLRCFDDGLLSDGAKNEGLQLIPVSDPILWAVPEVASTSASTCPTRSTSPPRWIRAATPSSQTTKGSPMVNPFRWSIACLNCDQMLRSIHCLIDDLGCAPAIIATGCPSLKIIRVGRLRTFSPCAVA